MKTLIQIIIASALISTSAHAGWKQWIKPQNLLYTCTEQVPFSNNVYTATALTELQAKAKIQQDCVQGEKNLADSWGNQKDNSFFCNEYRIKCEAVVKLSDLQDDDMDA